jgi:hypothetical protein
MAVASLIELSREGSIGSGAFCNKMDAEERKEGTALNTHTAATAKPDMMSKISYPVYSTIFEKIITSSDAGKLCSQHTLLHNGRLRLTFEPRRVRPSSNNMPMQDRLRVTVAVTWVHIPCDI